MLAQLVQQAARGARGQGALAGRGGGAAALLASVKVEKVESNYRLVPTRSSLQTHFFHFKRIFKRQFFIEGYRSVVYSRVGCGRGRTQQAGGGARAGLRSPPQQELHAQDAHHAPRRAPAGGTQRLPTCHRACHLPLCKVHSST